ncbi:MAG TPA: hypothetical protein VJ224_04145 [Thermoplasmata archaeon]|nr:hypothetical protein [Thermoplasmata archaeon]
MDAAELTTFGAVLRFSLNLESDASSFFDRLANGPLGGEFPKLARELAAGHRRRTALLEQVRSRVNEMTLEPIRGLRSPDEGLGRAVGGSATPAAAADLEEAIARFYTEVASAGRAILGEATRTFQRFAAESGRNAVRLRTAQSPGFP